MPCSALPLSRFAQVNGQELAELDMSQWRQRLGWLSQNPQLFHASLRDNLLLARPAASDAELEAVLRRAQAWEFVSEKGWTIGSGIRRAVSPSARPSASPWPAPCSSTPS